MPTFGAWEATVLEHAYDVVDHISLHAYYEPIDGDRDGFLACAEDMDRFIESVVATADHVAALKRSATSGSPSPSTSGTSGTSSASAREQPGDPRGAPLIEDVYSVTDAVVVGSLLITLLSHADRVTMACLAQLVNVIAPISTRRPAWRQTIFHPFALTARYAAGTVLQTAVVIDAVETNGLRTRSTSSVTTATSTRRRATSSCSPSTAAVPTTAR